MISYPSIGRDVRRGLSLYVFDKLDGSNIRAEWSPRGGFARFGSRRRLLSADHPSLGEAIGLFQQGPASRLDTILREREVPGATAFFEFHGPGSFAGMHADELHTVTLIDIHIAQRGLLPPGELLDWIGDAVPSAPLLHHGPVDDALVARIRAGRLAGMGGEGVVCKGLAPPRRADKPPKRVVFKIKTRAWLARLREHCAGDEGLFQRLA